MKKTTPKTKVSKTEETGSSYTANLNLKSLRKVYESTGQSVVEAIQKLTPVQTARGVAVLTITRKGVSKQKILSPSQVFRLFNGSRVTKEITLKSVSSLFSL